MEKANAGWISGLNETRELLDRYPTAVITALNPNALIVPLPVEIRLGGHRVLEGRSLVEWVVTEDRPAVSRAWLGVRLGGSSQAPVRMLSNPNLWLSLRLINISDGPGLVVAIIAPEGVDGQPVDSGSFEAAQSRFASYRQDDAGVILDCDAPSAAMLGFSPDQLVATQGLDLVHPDDQAQVIDAWLEAMATRRPCTMRYRHRHGTVAWLWVDGTIHNNLGQNGTGSVLVELIDVSEVVAAKEDLDALLATVSEGDREAVDQLLAGALETGTDGDLSISYRRPGGETGNCLMSVRTLITTTALVAGAIVCVSDTTESERMRCELEDRATFDVLTRCRNRATVMSALDDLLTQADAGNVGVIFIDLNKFKPVNDLLGHAAGDALLVAVAGRFEACLQAGDLLGRIGGDEFLVVRPDVTGPEEVLGLAHRISASLRGLIPIGGHSIEVGASIGVACSSVETTADDLVAIADDAMYKSKRRGDGLPVLGRRASSKNSLSKSRSQ